MSEAASQPAVEAEQRSAALSVQGNRWPAVSWHLGCWTLLDNCVYLSPDMPCRHVAVPIGVDLASSRI